MVELETALEPEMGTRKTSLERLELVWSVWDSWEKVVNDQTQLRGVEDHDAGAWKRMFLRSKMVPPKRYQNLQFSAPEASSASDGGDILQVPTRSLVLGLWFALLLLRSSI